VRALTAGSGYYPTGSVTNLSLDHLVSAQQERLGDRDAERFRGRQIDDEIESGRLLDGDAGRFRPAQNLVNKIGGAPP
jgi:hypothetical protein